MGRPPKWNNKVTYANGKIFKGIGLMTKRMESGHQPMQMETIMKVNLKIISNMAKEKPLIKMAKSMKADGKMVNSWINNPSKKI
jgi:hypothetical protein